jgi:hypothetical protein
MDRDVSFRPDVRSRRTSTYLMWMLSVAFLLIGLSFSMGSILQIIFLSLSVGLFVLSRSISSSIRAR